MDNGEAIIDLSVPGAITVGETYKLVNNETGVATDARLMQISIYDDNDPDPEIEVKFAGGIQATWASEPTGDGSIQTTDGETLWLYKPHTEYEPGLLKGGKRRRTARRGRRLKRRRTTRVKRAP